MNFSSRNNCNYYFPTDLSMRISNNSKEYEEKLLNRSRQYDLS